MRRTGERLIVSRSIVSVCACLVSSCTVPLSSEPGLPDASSAQSAQEFQNALHTCQHLRRPAPGDAEHPAATAPQVEQCLAKKGWRSDGAPILSESFRRDLQRCQQARSKRHGRPLRKSPWDWDVQRCLKAKGWNPDGTSISDTGKDRAASE